MTPWLCRCSRCLASRPWEALGMTPPKETTRGDETYAKPVLKPGHILLSNQFGGLSSVPAAPPQGARR